MEIFRQQIDVTKQINEIQMPKDSEIIKVMIHKSNPHIVYKCEPDNERETRKIKIYENGENIHGRYIDTVSWKDTMYHVFESEKIISSER